MDAPAIELDRLTFRYADGTQVFSQLSLTIPAGARCLLLGANGVGKTTLLRIVAGRHMLPAGAVKVFGRAAFDDTTLVGAVSFIGGPFPFAVDMSVGEILERRPNIAPGRRAKVLEMLDVDPGWRMHRVSDGQRRRVQLLLELERSVRLVLMDEVTAELDVLARADLLRFLREESERDGLTIVYASHVIEGLQAFGTHLMYLSPGRMRVLAPMSAVPELIEKSAGPDALAPLGAVSALHRLCEKWMMEDRKRR